MIKKDGNSKMYMYKRIVDAKLFIDNHYHEDLILSGIDQDGEVRIVEHSSNRFFVSTLFVPQTKSTISKTHPLIERFVLECTK